MENGDKEYSIGKGQVVVANEQLIREVCQDEMFMKSLLTLETPEEVQASLRGRGIELSVDEIKAIRIMLMKKIDAGEELSESELAEVTGGVYLAMTAGAIIFFMVLGGIVGAGGGAIGATLVGGAVLAGNLTNNAW